MLRIQATFSNISRVVDQVCALKCTVAGSKPSMGPVCYREARSNPSKSVRNFNFDPFLRFFPFHSLGCVPEDTCPAICGVRLAERPTSRGTTVLTTNTRRVSIYKMFQKWKAIGIAAPCRGRPLKVQMVEAQKEVSNVLCSRSTDSSAFMLGNIKDIFTDKIK